MKYKHVVLTRIGGPEVLEIKESKLPEPEAGEIRVKILAAGIAFADVMMRYGKYPGTPPLPFTPGYDIVGIVEQHGPSVSEPAVGQVIAALPRFGGYSQYICIPAKEAVPVSPSIDPAEAVCLILNYVTAYQMLHRLAHVKAGERLLVHGAAGGVGTALLQLGKLAHLDMYGTASSTKQNLIASSGATPIDYKTEDFVKRIRDLTGDGVDVVCDPIGGPHVRRSFQTLRKGGRLIAYGFSASIQQGNSLFLTALRQFFDMALWALLPNGKKVMTYSIAGFRGFKEQHPEWFREDLTTLLRLLAEGKIKPVIAALLPLEEAARAHELVEQAQVQGKVVLLPNAKS